MTHEGNSNEHQSNQFKPLAKFHEIVKQLNAVRRNDIHGKIPPSIRQGAIENIKKQIEALKEQYPNEVFPEIDYGPEAH